MAGEPVVTIIGNLTADPELRFTPNGSAVANFTVASTPRVRDQQNGWRDGDTMFVRCSVWNRAAENVADSLTKGVRVIATGRLKVRNYETRDGRQGTSIELEVDEVGPSLQFATAQVARVNNSGGDANYRGGNRGGQMGSEPSGGGYENRAEEQNPWYQAEDTETPF